MKKHLLLIALFILMGCAIPYKPIKNPDQRIHFERFSFLPPNGENWGMFRPHDYGRDLHWGAWGRANIKSIDFQKSNAGQNQTSDKVETGVINIFKYEFGIIHFDHDNDLMEFTQEKNKRLIFWGIRLLESKYSHEKFNNMHCVKYKIKAEGEKEHLPSVNSAFLMYSERVTWGAKEVLHSRDIPNLIYYQGYVCVHPRHPNHLIELKVRQMVAKGQTPTDIQNEIDYVFNSVEFH